MNITAETITTAQIRALRTEAEAAGDRVQVAIDDDVRAEIKAAWGAIVLGFFKATRATEPARIRRAVGR